MTSPKKLGKRGAMRGDSPRLALVALSGVRVVDPELRALGLTLPGFVERGRAIAELPSLGLLTLAAYAPEHWSCEYHEADEGPLRVLARTLLEAAADVVAISALSARIADAYRFADILRDAGVYVVLGGLHVSALPGEAAPHADSIVVGEGELAFAQFCADWEAGCARSVYATPLVAPRLPAQLAAEACVVRELGDEDMRVPRYDLLDPQNYDRVSLQASRACPLDCVFCAASRTIAPYRKKPLALVRRELDEICARWERPYVELADDNTFVDARWGRELVELLTEYSERYDMRWFTETDIRVSEDASLLEALASSSCVQLLVGLESPRAAALRGVDGRDWKAARAAELRERVARIHDYGIAVHGCFVLGFDADEASCFDETLDYVDALDLAEVQITVLTPFPGTALHARLEREGRLRAPRDWSRCTLFDVNYEPALMSPEELERGFRSLMAELYSEARVAKRRARRRALQRRARERRKRA